MMIATTTMHSPILLSNENDELSQIKRPKRRMLWRPSTSHSPGSNKFGDQQQVRNRISLGCDGQKRQDQNCDPRSINPVSMLSTLKRSDTKYNVNSHQDSSIFGKPRKNSVRKKVGPGSRSGEKRRFTVVADSTVQSTSEIMPHTRLMGLPGKGKNIASTSTDPSSPIHRGDQRAIKMGEGSRGTQKRSEGIPIRTRRPSSQSLTLDLDGLDLGPHPQSASLMKPTAHSPMSSSWQKENILSPRTISTGMPIQQPISSQRHDSDHQCDHIPSQIHDEDTFAVHLRDCEDAHDIPTVESILQNPSKKPSEEQKAPQTNHSASSFPETNEYVLGGFASLGIVKTPRPPIKTSLGSDTDLTGSSSSIGLVSSLGTHAGTEDRLSPWTTLKLQQRDPYEIVDILSIDEMGLHSINVGSTDDWRGTALVASSSGENNEQSYPDAEWSVARNQKRQRKWIVTPTARIPERTVVVSDHITRKKNVDLVTILHPSAFSGFSSFSLRFLQAGSRSPDCTIILATPSSHRGRIEEQQWRASPVSTSNLSSKGLHEEQMQSWDVISSGTTTNDEDAWPSLRARTTSSNMPPFGSPSPVLRERRLTHSKSTSTIVASFSVDIESRRPSLGKSMSHEGLAPDASPKPNDYLFNDVTRSFDSTHNRSLDAATKIFGVNAVKKSPFEDYSIDRKTCPSNATDQGTKSASDLAPDEVSGISPRSSMNAMNAVKREMRPREQCVPIVPSSKVLETPFVETKAGKREKRIGDWLRRKVMPVGSNLANISHSQGTSSNLRSPPLPPAWEPMKAQTYVSSRLTNQNVIEASVEEIYDQRNLAGKADLSGSTPSQLVAYPAPVKTLKEAAMPALDIINQRRRSNSDDVVTAINEAQRKRAQALVMGNNATDIATRKARSASGSAKLFTSSTIHPEGVKQDLHSSTIPMVSASEVNQAENASGPYSNQSALLDTTPKIFAPDLLGLNDVPPEAMTMIIALPLGNHTESSYASRYLRVSFVPFQVAASSSHGSEDMQAGTPNIGASNSSGQHDSPLNNVTSMNGQEPIVQGEGAGNELSSTSTSGLNWYRRLAHAWHATPSTQSASSDDESSAYNRSPPPGLVSANTNEQHSKPFSSSENREAFRIIAKVLANDQLPSSLGLTPAGQTKNGFESTTSSTTITTPLTTNVVNVGVPQPFSFPVILGMCDNLGRLDLIPEGWQAIGLANGPAPDTVPVTIHSGSESAATMINVSHPLRGVADLIIAGCAACMDL